MAALSLTTYKDLIDHAIDYLGADVSTEAERYSRRAVQSGYRDLVASHRWSYFFQRGRINTVAQYNTGTVAYVHTGGTYERQLTLTSGTWPTWATFGVVLMANIAYEVAEYKTSTVITLSATSNPGADVAAGTSYTLYRDTYPLPLDFVSCDVLFNSNQNMWLTYQHPREWLSRQRLPRTPATPYIYTLSGEANYFGALAVRFYPGPDQAYPIDFMYQRRGRALTLDEYKTGTVSITTGSATATGSGTTWTSKMIGAVLRFSTASSGDAPTGPGGVNPAVAERVIMDVASATSLTMDAVAADTLSGVKYCISDPVDIEEGSLHTALLREIEKQMRIVRRIKTTPEEVREYEMAMMHAREVDSRFAGPRSAQAGAFHGMRMKDYPLGADSG